MVCTINNQKIILSITGLIMLPLQLVNYLCLYFFNIPNSPAQDVTNAGIFGFTTAADLWIDVIVFNLLFIYVFLYLKSNALLLEMRKKLPDYIVKPATW